MCCGAGEADLSDKLLLGRASHAEEARNAHVRVNSDDRHPDGVWVCMIQKIRIEERRPDPLN